MKRGPDLAISDIPRINLKGKLKFNKIWPLEGPMYITLWSNLGGHPKNVMQFSQNIDGFRQNNSQGL